MIHIWISMAYIHQPKAYLGQSCRPFVPSREASRVFVELQVPQIL